MAYTEAKVLKQVAVLPAQNAVNVQWSNVILKDGVVHIQQVTKISFLQKLKVVMKTHSILRSGNHLKTKGHLQVSHIKKIGHTVIYLLVNGFNV